MGLRPSIGSILPQEKSSHHACPLQWVVHTAGYLESPPSLRRSRFYKLTDLVDRSPSETGRPPRDLTMGNILIHICIGVLFQSQNS